MLGPASSKPVPRSELIAFGVAYALFSSTLLVVNKWALTFTNTPNVLVFLQSVSTVVLMYMFITIRQGTPVPKFPDGTPFSNRSNLGWYCLSTMFQSVAIATNLMALTYLGVDRVILIRVCAMVPIAFGDYFFNNRMMPTVSSWICFLSLGLAAAFVFGGDSGAVTLPGVLWGTAYMIAISADQVFLKMFANSVKMPDASRALWMNLFGSVVSLVLAFAAGEWLTLSTSITSFFDRGVYAIALSCVLGAGISITAWGLRERATAVTFSLIGVICKIGSMALNYFVLDHVSPVSILIISFGITSTVFYEQAPERSAKSAVAAAAAKPREPINKLALVVLFLIVATGTSSKMSHAGIAYLLIGADITNSSAHSGPAPVAPPPTTPRFILPGDLPESRNHSWARCIGHVVSDTPWRYRSCHFKAICYNGEPAGQLTYFAHPDDDVQAEDLATSTMVPYVTDVRAPAKKYAVSVIRDSVPAGAVWPYRDAALERPVIVVPADFFIPGVWTHLVMDNLFPIYKLAELFDVVPERVDVRPHWLSYPCPRDGYHEACDFSDRRFNQKWIHLLNHGKWNFTKLQTSYGPELNASGWVCFDNALTGLSLFSDHGTGWSEHGRRLSDPVWTNWGISYSVERFRDLTMQRAGEISTTPTYTGPFYDVIFMRKGKSASAANGIDSTPAADALTRRLAAWDPGNTTTVAREVYLEEYSIHDQMMLVSRAKVVVSQVGSTAYGSLWLPRGATLILLYQGEMLDFYFWENLAYINTRYVHYPTPAQDERNADVVNRVIAGLSRWTT